MIMSGQDRRGFTLIEVLLALTVFSIIATALYGAFWASHRAVQGNEESLLRLHELRMALDVMRREVEAAMPKAGEGYDFVLRDRDFYGKQASQMELTTFLSSQPGPMRISYRVEEEEGRLSLLKNARPAFSKDESERDAEVLEEINSFTVEADSGGQWVKTWNGGRPPQVVRITISVPYKGRELTLTETMTPRIGTGI